MLENDYVSVRWTEFLSPDQFFSDRLLVGNAPEELSLQWAVFMDGLQQYWTLAENEIGRNSEEFIQEEAWMLVDDEEWPFSFAHLCEIFGLQPTSVRASLVAWKEARLSSEASSESDAKKKTFRGLPQI
jgi:hypothetical protein